MRFVLWMEHGYKNFINVTIIINNYLGVRLFNMEMLTKKNGVMQMSLNESIHDWKFQILLRY